MTQIKYEISRVDTNQDLQHVSEVAKKLVKVVKTFCGTYKCVPCPDTPTDTHYWRYSAVLCETCKSPKRPTDDIRPFTAVGFARCTCTPHFMRIDLTRILEAEYNCAPCLVILSYDESGHKLVIRCYIYPGPRPSEGLYKWVFDLILYQFYESLQTRCIQSIVESSIDKTQDIVATREAMRRFNSLPRLLTKSLIDYATTLTMFKCPTFGHPFGHYGLMPFDHLCLSHLCTAEDCVNNENQIDKSDRDK